MQCAKHQDHESSGVCAYSGKPYCEHELVEVNGRMYGKDHLSAVFDSAKAANAPQQVFMAGGGAAAVAALPHRKPINHMLHVILTLCTAGLWLPIYLLLLLARSCGS